MTAPTLETAARQYLQRWRDYLNAHPDADPTAVNRAMLSGEPPPDLDEREKRRAEIARERRADVTGKLTTVSKLTHLQRRFLIEYLSQLRPDASKAYVAAGGTAKHAGRAAYQIRHHPAVVSAIEDYFHGQEMGVKEAIAITSQIARNEFSDYINDDGTIDLARMRDEGKTNLVKMIRPTQAGPVVEPQDQQAALDKILRYHGAYQDKTENTGEVTIRIVNDR